MGYETLQLEMNKISNIFVFYSLKNSHYFFYCMSILSRSNTNNILMPFKISFIQELVMSSLNHAFVVIEELSTEERFEDIIITEHKHSQDLYKAGKIQAETVDEMFERLDIQ